MDTNNNCYKKMRSEGDGMVVGSYLMIQKNR